ncbi:MAG: helix-turn-helix domain-containing protein, partial [Bacteroidota bacterium]
TLNQRYQPNFSPADEEGYITLSSHNKTTRALNTAKLEALEKKAYTYQAIVMGNFPESMFPNEAKLTFKVGAQVMFNKNDTGERLYYNGKIGVITDIFGDEIRVECPGDEEAIDVLPVTWENRKYELDPETKEIEDKVVGTYEQHPLKLAWAITIHKSQGLTFDKVIIDAQAAFAHGQVYVALSRCKTFEGIVLKTPIENNSVHTDHVVRDYSQKAEENSPTEKDLLTDKHRFQADALRELFNFSQTERAAQWLQRSLLEHERAIQGDSLTNFEALRAQMQEKAFAIGNKFLPWLEIYFRDPVLPTEHPKLKERLEGAVQYFLPYLRSELLPALREFQVLTDNKSVRQQVDERLEGLQFLVYTKCCLFESLNEGFDPTNFMRAKANAQLDFTKKGETKPKRFAIPSDLPNRELYLQLAKWRHTKAEDLDIAAYQIAANKTLLEVVEVLPTTKKSLLRVRGLGPKRFEQHGQEVLDIVAAYLADKGIEEHDLFVDLLTKSSSSSGSKPHTSVVTLNLYNEGKSVAEIAQERDLKPGTIITHLLTWVGEGKVPVTAILAQEKVDILRPYFEAHPDGSLKDAFLHFEEEYSYNELRAVRAWMTYETSG